MIFCFHRPSRNHSRKSTLLIMWSFWNIDAPWWRVLQASVWNKASFITIGYFGFFAVTVLSFKVLSIDSTVIQISWRFAYRTSCRLRSQSSATPTSSSSPFSQRILRLSSSSATATSSAGYGTLRVRYWFLLFFYTAEALSLSWISGFYYIREVIETGTVR